jgi:hypothetical protein
LIVTSPQEQAAKRKVFLPMSPVQVSSPGTWRPPPPSQKSPPPVVPVSVSLSVPVAVVVSVAPVLPVVASVSVVEVVAPVVGPVLSVVVASLVDPVDVAEPEPSVVDDDVDAVVDDVGSVALIPEEKPEVVALVSSPPEQAARPKRATNVPVARETKIG